MSDVNNTPENNEAPVSKPAENHAPEHIANLAEDLSTSSNASYGTLASQPSAEDATPSAPEAVEIKGVHLKETTTLSSELSASLARRFMSMDSTSFFALPDRPLSPVASRIKRRESITSVKDSFEKAIKGINDEGHGHNSYRHSINIFEVTNPDGLNDYPKSCRNSKLEVEEVMFRHKAVQRGFTSISHAMRMLGGFDTMSSFAAEMAKIFGPAGSFNTRQISLRTIFVKKGARRRISQATLDAGWVRLDGDRFIKFDKLNRPIAGVHFDFCGSESAGNFHLDAPRTWGYIENHIDFFIDLIRPELEERTLGSAKLTTIQGISAQGGLQTVDDSLEGVQLANSTFYPWMNGVSLEEYFMEFLMSDANVLILYGPPGTAKSTMIRTAVKNLGLRALGTSNQQLIGNPQFLTACGSTMTGSSSSAPYDVLIAEDAEILTRSRQLGNPLMATLLDVTSGMSAKHSFKLIITMNSENLDDVDTALLRPGRCFDIMKFGYLNEGEAANVRTSLKLPEVSIPKGKYVLAEVVNMGVTKTELIDGNAIVSPRFPLTAANKL